MEIVVTWAVFLAGSAILCYWLLTTGFGTTALTDIPRRRTKLPLFVPFVVLLAWMSTGVALMSAAKSAKAEFNLDEGTAIAVQYGGFALLDVCFIALMCWVGHQFFARRLRGFGIRFRHWWADFWRAGATLLAVLPIVIGLVQIVALVGEHFVGPDFKMEENEGLKDLAAASSVWVKALIIIFAGIIVPVYEEMLFRGLFQSVVRRLTGRPWASIIATSAVFAALHPPMHVPALFVLSIAIGYSYEKSGSLIRSIWVHVLFNCSMMAVALASQ
jgi:membrane protease YdiL (CAAX protease family)